MRHTKLKESYTVGDYIAKGYAELCSRIEEDGLGQISYLPRHSAIHPIKPDNGGLVFDCAGKNQNTSLNVQLLSGPHLTNSVPRGEVCWVSRYQCDVLSQPQRSCLGFLWWAEGDLERVPDVQQITVHPFGATFSPCCPMFISK